MKKVSLFRLFPLWALLAGLGWAAFSFSTRVPQPHEALSPAALLSFHATLPQGRRLFASILSRFLLMLGCSSFQAVFLVECAAATFFLLGLRRFFSRFVPQGPASLAALSAILLLPPLFSDMDFQPWDTWMMTFLSWTLAFLCESRFLPLAILAPFASLNHESALLIPLLFLAVHAGRLPVWRSPRSLFWIALLLFAIHFSVLGLAGAWAAPRAIDSFYLPENVFWGMVLRHSEITSGLHVVSPDAVFDFNWRLNLGHLAANPLNVVTLLFCMSMLPVAFAFLWKCHAPESRRCALVALFHVASVFIAGLVFETRCFAATVAILYPLVALAVFHAMALPDSPYPRPLLAPVPAPVQRRLAILEVVALLLLPVAVLVFIALEPHLLPPLPPPH